MNKDLCFPVLAGFTLMAQSAMAQMPLSNTAASTNKFTIEREIKNTEVKNVQGKRDGKPCNIPVEELVPGDIITLKGGMVTLPLLYFSRNFSDVASFLP